MFLTREFRDLGGEDQILRALRLVGDRQLVRLGYGVYGRAEKSRLSGEPILAARGGFIFDATDKPLLGPGTKADMPSGNCLIPAQAGQGWVCGRRSR